MESERGSLNQKQRTATIVLTLALLALSLGIWLFFTQRQKGADMPGPENMVVVIEAEGKQMYAVPLTDDNELPVLTKGGNNVVRISKGQAFVESADCKNQICVHSEPISKPGETIVCLPHRVVVSITVRSR